MKGRKDNDQRSSLVAVVSIVSLMYHSLKVIEHILHGHPVIEVWCDHCHRNGGKWETLLQVAIIVFLIFRTFWNFWTFQILSFTIFWRCEAHTFIPLAPSTGIRVQWILHANYWLCTRIILWRESLITWKVWPEKTNVQFHFGLHFGFAKVSQ